MAVRYPGTGTLVFTLMTSLAHIHMTAEAKPANPGVRFPPPTLFLAGLLVAWLLETYVLRIRFVGRDVSTVGLEAAGVFLLIVGGEILAWGLFMFVRMRTAILPMRPATRLVETGPYRISRNPMYTGMAIAYLGGMLLMNWVWALVMFPVVMTAVYRLVIQREERYLAAVFGEEYKSYCRRVRRWI